MKESISGKSIRVNELLRLAQPLMLYIQHMRQSENTNNPYEMMVSRAAANQALNDLSSGDALLVMEIGNRLMNNQ